MKRFRFSLQALLTVRQRQEQMTLEAYSKALAAQQQAADRLTEAQHQCEQAWKWIRQRRISTAPAAHLVQLDDYATSIEQFRERCAEALHQAQQISAATLEKYLVARKAREAVDKFQLRQREHFEHQVRREEQKLIDDRAQRAPTAAVGLLSAQENWN